MKIKPILKKGLLVVFASVSLGLWGCATGKTVYYPTNAELIDSSIDTVSQKLVNLPISKRDKIAISYLEIKGAETQLPHELIYHQIATVLKKNGYSVVEREKGALQKLSPEAGGRLYLGIFPYISITEGTLNYDILLGTREKWAGIRGTYPTQSGVDALGILLSPGVQTVVELPASDYLLLFYVVETGIRYGEGERKGMVTNIERRALTRLNVRIISTRTGEIVFSDIVEGVVVDQVPSQMVKVLEKPLYTYYPHTMPEYALQAEEKKREEPMKGISTYKEAPEKIGYKEKMGYKHSIIPFLAGLRLTEDYRFFWGVRYEYDFNEYLGIDAGVGYSIIEDYYGELASYILPNINVLARYPISNFEPFAGLGLDVKIYVGADEQEKAESIITPGINLNIGTKYLFSSRYGLKLDLRYHVSDEVIQELTPRPGTKIKYTVSEGDDLEIGIGFIVGF